MAFFGQPPNSDKTMTRFIFILLLISSSFFAFTQTINPVPGQLYRDDVIPRIDIILPADSLAWILDPANEESNYHFHATFVFANGTIRDTLDNVGFRLRGNSSRDAWKKSFKVSFNTYEAGRKYYGVEKLNLNGEHNDPTLVRAKACWDLARGLGLPAARVNHVQLYINGNYRGVYSNVEHIDEEFVESRFGNKGGNLYKCLYPANLAYKGSDPNLYKEVLYGRRTYDLKTNTAVDDYTDLANFIAILNNTPANDLPCTLGEIFNIEQYLKTIAFDIVTGNWDGPIYNQNNFYLYHNEETGKFEYIPYDLDNTMGIDWLDRDWGTRNIYTWNQTGQTRPIYTRLMTVQKYKDRFSYYLNQLLNDLYEESTLFPYLDNLKTTLLPLVSNDPFYPLDYNFSIAEFQDGFEMTLPWMHTDYGVKPFITTRRNSALNQLSLSDIAPVITQVNTNHPTEFQAIEIKADVFDDVDLVSVEFCYNTTNPSDITCVPMLDDGTSNDGLAADGTFGLILPPFNTNTLINYQIIARDNLNASSFAPACGYESLFAGSSSLILAINEIVASNTSINADNFGEYDDWIEIYNYGNMPIFLGDKYLSDNAEEPTKWQMPALYIQPNEYLLFWADKAPEQGANHTNFKLSAGGEFVGLFDNATAYFARIDGLDFGAQQSDVAWGRYPNGTGNFQALLPSPAAPNQLEVAISSAPSKTQITVFPNPFNEFLSLILEPKLSSLTSIQIYNLQGVKYVDFQVNSSMEWHQIRTDNLPAGVYVLVVLEDGELIFSSKLIK